MSRSDWRLIVAFVGFLGFGCGVIIASLSYRDQQHEQRITAYERADGKHQRPQQYDTDHAAVPGFVQAYASNPEPADQKERENRDLAAQENTAAWAFWMVALSAAQLVLSGAGLVALVITIRQGRASIDRADRANQIALEAATAQSRPILLLDRIDLRGGLARAFKCVFIFKNAGNSPAYLESVILRRHVTRLFGAQTRRETDTIDCDLSVRLIVLPNAEVELPAILIFPEHPRHGDLILSADIHYSSAMTLADGSRGRIYESGSQTQIIPTIVRDGRPVSMIAGMYEANEVIGFDVFETQFATKMT